MNINILEKKASDIRLTILNTVTRTKKGHIGGAFSCTDILVTLYHGGILRHDPRNPEWPDRDRLILSKGHAGIALFSILADLGYFACEDLEGYCQEGSRLGGHPDRRVPGVEADTGSLGHGIGVGVGLALGAKLDGRESLVFVLMGDGECYEGSVWEALLFASHHKLNNLVIIIDRNNQCVLDYTEDCVKLEPFEEKLSSFGLSVLKVDGHSYEELLRALNEVKSCRKDKPTAIVANTVKGRGVSFMEGQIKWHHGIPTPEEYQTAVNELSLGCKE